MSVRTCNKCGKPLPKGAARFCSNDCKWSAKRKEKPSFTCKTCGSRFHDVPSQRRVYCSKACQLNQKRTSELASRRRECLICDVEFYVDGASRKGKTCSSECLSQLRSLNRIGRTDPDNVTAKRGASIKRVWATEGQRWDSARLASKWILKSAIEALHSDTDYVKMFTLTQERLRLEAPFDGTIDYMDYLRELGRAVVGAPECRSLSNSFMAKAIPFYGAEWKRRTSDHSLA